MNFLVNHQLYFHINILDGPFICSIPLNVKIQIYVEANLGRLSLFSKKRDNGMERNSRVELSQGLLRLGQCRGLANRWGSCTRGQR